MRTLKLEELDISTATREALKNTDTSEISALQESIISNIGSQQDLAICAEPGREKHTALAVITREVLEKAGDDKPAVLILTSLADSIEAIGRRLHDLGIDAGSYAVIDNQGNNEKQAEALRSGPGVIIGNPDRLQSLLQEHRFIFRNISLVILDELDKLADSGESDNLKRIKRRVLSDYTTLACSERWDGNIKKITSSFAGEPAVVGFTDSASAGTPPAIRGDLKQGYINVPYRMKISTLMAHIEQTPSDNCVIFTASKRGTDRLYRVLKKRGLKATSLHGKLSDDKRAQRFSNFTNGDVQFLLVADLSAAELDLHNVHQVINYDVPSSSDEYRFRAGIIGTAKDAGIVSLVSKQDRSDISELQNELGQTPDEIPLPDKVKQKLKERKNKKSNGQKKQRGGGKKQRPKRGGSQKGDNDMELPRPSYDKLSGGRSGDHDKEKTGIVKFFKKLFS